MADAIEGDSMDTYGISTGSSMDTRAAIETAMKHAEAQAAFDKSRAAAEVERSPTLSDLVALSDQLEAAVQDVADAWMSFQQGDLPRDPGGRVMDRAASTYRIDRLHAGMHEQIGALGRIARDIRSRV